MNAGAQKVDIRGTNEDCANSYVPVVNDQYRPNYGAEVRWEMRKALAAHDHNCMKLRNSVARIGGAS